MSTIQLNYSFKRVNRFLKEGGRLLNNFSDNKVVVSYKDYLISTGNKNNYGNRLKIVHFYVNLIYE